MLVCQGDINSCLKYDQTTNLFYIVFVLLGLKKLNSVWQKKGYEREVVNEEWSEFYIFLCAMWFTLPEELD